MKMVSLVINGGFSEFSAPIDMTLLEALRDSLGVRGAKEGCGRGECGACTVLVDGVPMMACLLLVHRLHGAVTTIEGLAQESADLRDAFAEHGGFQCGFCTSGQIVRAEALLRAGLPADRIEAERVVRHGISGNVCRCTGYNGIVDAILDVAAKRRSSSSPTA